MSLTELLPSVRSLSRTEKLRLIQFLAQSLAEVEETCPIEAGQTYPIWSPLDATKAAAVLLQVLESEKSKP